MENDEQFAQGMMGMLKPVVDQLNSSVYGVLTSQEQLSLELDRLSKQLDAFMEVSNVPELQGYVDKLQASKKRVGNVNSTLKGVSSRLDKLEAYTAQARKERGVEEEQEEADTHTATAAQHTAQPQAEGQQEQQEQEQEETQEQAKEDVQEQEQAQEDEQADTEAVDSDKEGGADEQPLPTQNDE